MANNQIIFSHLLFNGADAFILTEDGEQYHFGNIRDNFNDTHEFFPYVYWPNRRPDIEWPTPEATIEEYKRQCAKAGKPVTNPRIQYAG